MIESSARDIFLGAVRGERTSRPAVATVDQGATFEQMDALGVRWPDAHTDAKLMARLAIGAYSILGFDAIKVPFCQTIEQEALGCTVAMGDFENLPSIAEHPYDLAAEPVQVPVFPEDFLKRGQGARSDRGCENRKKRGRRQGGRHRWNHWTFFHSSCVGWN